MVNIDLGPEVVIILMAIEFSHGMLTVSDDIKPPLARGVFLALI